MVIFVPKNNEKDKKEEEVINNTKELNNDIIIENSLNLPSCCTGANNTESINFDESYYSYCC